MFLRLCYSMMILLAVAGKLGAQRDTMGMAYADAHSYRLYLSGDWQALDHFSDRALRQGYDYYYLRMRAGIACFQTQAYRKAIRHFQKALEFNAQEETAIAYLYESYRYAGQYDEARRLVADMDSSLRRVAGANHLKDLSFLALESGVKLSDSASKFKPALYVQVAAQHYIRQRFSLFHALTFYSQDEYRQKIRQYQYYLSAAIPLRQGFVLSPAVHVIYDDLKIREISTSRTVTYLPPPPSSPGQPPLPPQQLVTVRTNTTFASRQTSALAGSLSLTKKFTWLDVSLGATAATFDTANQYQLQAGFACYPFANRRLAIGVQVMHHTETSYRQGNFAFNPYVSSLLHRRLLVSASWTGNRGGNVSENNAYLINNSIDVSLSRLTAMAEYNFTKHISLYAVYSYDTRQEKFQAYRYHYQLALLGIKYIP